MRLLGDAKTTNFVLDFGDDCAWCAVNLDSGEFGRLLGRGVCLFLFFFCFFCFS